VEVSFMRVKSVFVGLAAALGVLVGSADRAEAQTAELKVGDAAPAFSLPGSDGKTHSLAASKGKRAVVLAWFPKAFTGG
jgi:peroxiredoxin Q/BCP